MASRKERALQQVLEECTKEQIARTLMDLCNDLGMYEAQLQLYEKPRVKHVLLYLRERTHSQVLWNCCTLFYNPTWDRVIKRSRQRGTGTYW